MAAMTALSTTSIVAIDSVSAARTTPSAPKKPSPPLMSGSVERVYPNRNARPTASPIVARVLSPRAVPTISPPISPIAHPVRQWSVALAAIELTLPIACLIWCSPPSCAALCPASDGW